MFLGLRLLGVESNSCTKGVGIHSLQHQALQLIVTSYKLFKEHRHFLIEESLATFLKTYSKKPIY